MAVRDPQAAGGGIVTELSLPERIVHAAEQAIQDIAATVFKGITGVESVEGYPTDLAKAAIAAAFRELAAANEHDTKWCRATMNGDCTKCTRLLALAGDLRSLADAVDEVRPLEVI